MRELDIAALMCSKLCHDLISPVGALANGLEILEEDDDAEMREHALALIQMSAKTASAKLQFARLAFGASGALGEDIELAMAEQVARGYFEGSKMRLTWDRDEAHWPKPLVRLVLNMMLMSSDAIPRGGTIAVSGPHTDVRIRLEGTHVRRPAGAAMLENPPSSVEGIDSRAIQPLLTALIAKDLGAVTDVTDSEEAVEVIIRVPPVAAAA